MVGPLLWALFPPLGSEGHCWISSRARQSLSPLGLEGKIFLLLNTDAKVSQTLLRLPWWPLHTLKVQEAGWMF